MPSYASPGGCGPTGSKGLVVDARDPAAIYRWWVTNRIHWDLWGDDRMFLDAGARLLRSPGGGIGWDVLAYPEGNEFCVFAPR